MTLTAFLNQCFPNKPARQLALVLIALCSVLALLDSIAGLSLRYERSAIASGQWWCLLTGHLLHLGPGHLVLNLAGLVLVLQLVAGWRFTRLMTAMVLLAVLVSLGLYILSPAVGWYVGLSGVLHGLLVLLLLTGRYRLVWVLAVLAVVALKLLLEQLGIAIPGTGWFAGGPVIVDAHLYGAVAGLALGWVARRLKLTS